jgi:hypothetical protein
MGSTADIFSWQEISLAPGQQITLIHWVVDQHGISLIEPDRWYWMSAVPEYGYNRPDRPVPGATVEVISQRPVRAPKRGPGPSNIDWLVTWHNPGPDFVHFRPRLLQVPAR